ncbi:MAG: manganese efflux pump [Clostridia bacterium]|nr:manganese efflux pump [Clostridia bacterium]
MDAFAVAICKGLSVQKVKAKHCLICGAYFGIFQGLMPLIGYFLGSSFQQAIESIDHWIVFGLLALIGLNMIRESRDQDECIDCSFALKAMFPLALATSIDALAVGVSFAFLKVDIVYAVTFIAVITFCISAVGVKLGQAFGSRSRSKAEFFGGVVLVLMGLKILLEHLGIL